MGAYTRCGKSPRGIPRSRVNRADLVLFGRVPLRLWQRQHRVQHHHLARDDRWADLPAVAILGLRERPVERLRVQVIDVPAVGLIHKAVRELPAHQRLQEVAHVLTVAHARNREVLPPQALAAVQRGRHEKAGLPRGEPERGEGGDAFGEGHPSHST